MKKFIMFVAFILAGVIGSALCRTYAEPPADYLREKAKAEALLEKTKNLGQPASSAASSTTTSTTTTSSVAASATQPSTTTTTTSTTPVNPVVPSVTIPPAGPAKLAMIVGIDKYKAVTGLRGCVNDARAMENLLRGKFGFEKDGIVTLLDEQATHAEIVRVFQEHLIAKARPESIIVFCFAGHGSQMKDDGDEEEDKLDETIVPYDSRQGNVYDITDDEINGLFRQLTAKTKHVTFFMDCCHSGAQVRVVELARRIEPDTRPPPAAPSYARAEARTSAVDERFEGRDYVLVAGCAAKEVSYEYTVPSTAETRGAMTYFFVESVNRLPPGKTTYRDVMQQVVIDVTRVYERQNPQLEGANADSFLFADESALQRPFVFAAPQGSGVEIAAGSVHGITKGSLLEVFPPQTREFPPGMGIATLEVESVHSFTSQARSLFGTVAAADSRAVLRQYGYQSGRLGVALSGLDGALKDRLTAVITSTTQLALEEKRDGPRYAEMFQLVDKPEQAEFLIEQLSVEDFKNLPATMNPLQATTVDQPVIVLRKPDGTLLAPPLPVADPTVVPTTLRRLALWGRWNRLAGLVNPGGTKLKVAFDVSSNVPGRKDGDRRFAVADGSRVEFVIKNGGSNPVYVAVVDLSSNGDVSVIYPPVGTRQAVVADHKVGITFSVPDPYRRVTDQLLLIATTSPVDYDFLRQEVRAVPGDSNPLVKMLTEAASASRAAVADPIVLDDWTVERLQVEIARP